MTRRDALLLGAAAGVAIGGIGWLVSRWATAPRGVEPVAVGDPFPDITAHRLDGTTMRLPHDLHGDLGLLIVTWDYTARTDLSDDVREVVTRALES